LLLAFFRAKSIMARRNRKHPEHQEDDHAVDEALRIGHRGLSGWGAIVGVHQIGQIRAARPGREICADSAKDLTLEVSSRSEVSE
jgi:hypothetical protein